MVIFILQSPYRSDNEIIIYLLLGDLIPLIMSTIITK